MQQSQTISSGSPISSSADVDTSPAALALRIRRRCFLMQDRARRMRSEGMKPAPIANALGIDSRMVDRHASCSYARQEVSALLVEHPDLESMKLTGPELMLLKSVLEVRIIEWEDGNPSDPDTGWVGRRIRRSSGWAVSCARRRLATTFFGSNTSTSSYQPNPIGVFRLSGNGYIGLSPLGWSLAATLHPDLVAQLVTWEDA